MIIGITGKSGVGKSNISKLIKKFGDNFEYIDFDSIGHQTLDDKEVQKVIKERLKIEVSSTNRKKLADLIFNSHKTSFDVALVSTLMWRKMKEIIDEKISDNSKNYAFDWILLPKTHYFEFCDIKILVVPANDKIRKVAVRNRDLLSKKDLKLRDKAAIEYNENDFDFIIKNNYSLDHSNKILYNLVYKR